MNYKKLVRNQERRFEILNVLGVIPDSLMIRLQYKIKLKRNLNLKNPKRFSEKLQWYKLNYRTSLMTTCADKLAVRDYVKSKGLGEILNVLYAVYEKPWEIEIDKLPNEFVIKTTNGSGTNIFCDDKNKFDYLEYHKLTTKWLNRNIFAAGREWAYKNIEPKIIVEEFLVDKENPFEGINDYKFICCNGEVEYVVLDVDRSTNHKRNIYTPDWKQINVGTDHDNIDKEILEPKCLEKMISIAQTLSKDFPFVRVDLYCLNNKVYFGELTFYPWTGYIQFTPDEFDRKLGDKFRLPEKKFEV